MSSGKFRFVAGKVFRKTGIEPVSKDYAIHSFFTLFFYNNNNNTYRKL